MDKNYAAVSTRFVAALLDGLIVAVVIFIIAYLISLVSGNSQSNTYIGNLVNSLATVAGYAYSVYFIGARGQTPGKMIMKIKVVKVDGSPNVGFLSAFLREVVGKFLSSLVFILGYLWAIWDPKKQAWHDKIAGTVVVKV